MASVRKEDTLADIQTAVRNLRKLERMILRDKVSDAQTLVATIDTAISTLKTDIDAASTVFSNLT